MQAKIDNDLCTGCGLCVDGCPAVFELEGDLARVIADPVPADQEDACREAAEGCPVEAITVS